MPATHPPEELLEVLVLAAEEISPPLHEALASHVRSCSMCRSVLGLLVQFHRAVRDEEVATIHADALVRAVFTTSEPSSSSFEGPPLERRA